MSPDGCGVAHGAMGLLLRSAMAGRLYKLQSNTHQILVLTKPLCSTLAIFYSLPNNEGGTKYRGLTYSTKSTVREICRATNSARQARLRI